MLKYLLVLLVAVTTCVAADSPTAKTDKNKTTLIIECPKCDIRSSTAVRNKDILCNGGTSTTNGVISHYSAKVACPHCKEKFNTQFDKFTKTPPKAVVIP